MDVDVAQRESSSIKRYASAFSNILMRDISSSMSDEWEYIVRLLGLSTESR